MTTSSISPRLRVACFLGAFALVAGCKPRLDVHVETNDDGVVIVDAFSDYGTEVKCNGKKPLRYDQIVFAARDFPVGKQTLTCTAEKKGRTRTVEVPFDRKPIEAKAKLAPKESGGYMRCGGDLCDEETRLNFPVDGKLALLVVAAVGTKVEIDGESATVELDEEKEHAATTPLTLDLTKRVADIPLAGFRQGSGDAYLELPAKITADETKKATLKLDVLGLSGVIRVALRGVDKGPVTFDGEPPAGKTPASLLYLGDGKTQFFGADTTLRGVDLVALGVKAKERPAGSCGSFVGTTGTTTVLKTATDTDVTVYDRRTGKLKNKRHFTAPYAECPSSVMSSTYGSETQTVASSVDEETILAWLATLLPKQ